MCKHSYISAIIVAVQTMKKSMANVSVKCILGFISRKGNFCEPCATNLFGKGCLQTCRCNELQRCDNIKGCVEKDTTRKLTTQSNIGTAVSSEESMTTLTVHEDEQTDGKIKLKINKNFQHKKLMNSMKAFETIEDGHLDRILLPRTCSSYLVNDDDSSSSESISNFNEDRASYLHPFMSSTTKGIKLSQSRQKPTGNSTCEEI
ncbi:unnamed protein product [Mytilus edulis]|uniref:Uncharacterized protein n=1 Tax=Mytilus edulis TaxID=6550 RepID=A0A8S3V2B2_MYTED|nr:unnamed protein product [Mytilus edulis]